MEVTAIGAVDTGFKGGPWTFHGRTVFRFLSCPMKPTDKAEIVKGLLILGLGGYAILGAACADPNASFRGIQA